jgi:hypothetical protein
MCIWSYIYTVYRANAVHCAILIPSKYATKIDPESTEIDRHRSRTQSSAIDFQIAYYFQMGSTGVARPHVQGAMGGRPLFETWPRLPFVFDACNLQNELSLRVWPPHFRSCYPNGPGRQFLEPPLV